MVNRQVALDRTFHALADPTRREIVARLARGQRSLSDLAQPFEMTLPAVHKHLRILEEARLVSSSREGRFRRCRLELGALDGASSWIQQRRTLWSRRLRSLERHLEQEKK